MLIALHYLLIAGLIIVAFVLAECSRTQLMCWHSVEWSVRMFHVVAPRLFHLSDSRGRTIELGDFQSEPSVCCNVD